MSAPKYTRANRIKYLERNYEDFEAQGLSYRQLAERVQNYFGIPKSPAQATIGRDLQEVRKRLNPNQISDEAKELLLPENFPEWRERFFEYQTSKTQHALFYMLRCLTLKEEIPDWVIEHFELPEHVNDDLIEKEKLLTFMLLMAPRHGKTMTMVHGLINLYCDNPDLRVIYCQGVSTTTEAINALVMIELEHNEDLVNMYGPFKDDQRQWSRTNGFILAKREHHSITSSFQPTGIQSNVRSLDADILVIDDPQDLDRAESEATTGKDYRKITTEFMTRREPHTPVLAVGSHLPTEFGDVWTQLEENLEDLRTDGQDVYINKRPAHHDEDCKVFSGEETEHYDCLEWPEYRNWNFLMAQKALLGEELYDAVYQQDARLSGVKPFPPEVVKGEFGQGGIRNPTRKWKETERRCQKWEDEKKCGGEIYTCIGFDPARGKGKKASFTAIAVVEACIKCQTYYLVDYHFERVSSDEHPGMVMSYAKSFKPQMVRIEINAYQEALARNKEVQDHAQRQGYVIDEWTTDDKKNTPELGIPMLAKAMKRNRFSIPYSDQDDINYGRELEKSLIRYPKKPNDIPMAIWLAVGGCNLLFEMYADLDPIYLRGRQENVPAYMIDGPLRVNLGAIGREGEYSTLEDVGT